MQKNLMKELKKHEKRSKKIEQRGFEEKCGAFPRTHARAALERHNRHFELL